MTSFSEGFWNIYIIVATLGGIFALYKFTRWQSKLQRPGEEGQSTGHVWDEDLTELNNPLPAWWRNLFYITLAWGVLYLCLYPGLGANDMYLGWTQEKQYQEEMRRAEERYGPIFEKYEQQPVEKVARDPDALKIGERLFASYCTQCHGADARGVRGFPNLRDDAWLWGGDPASIEESILKGRQGAMPAWGSQLGEKGVENVTQHVLALAGREHDENAAAQGAQKYDQLCVACHGPQGTGNPDLGAPDLTDDVWLYGGSPKTIAASIRNGRQGRMPAHEEFLGEAKVHLLAAYVYSLSR